MDRSFPAIPLHEAAVQRVSAMSAQPDQIGHGSHLVRGTIDHADLDNLTRSTTTPQGQPRLSRRSALRRIPTCHGDPPLGTSLDVQRLLGAGRLLRLGMGKDGCAIAIVIPASTWRI